MIVISVILMIPACLESIDHGFITGYQKSSPETIGNNGRKSCDSIVQKIFFRVDSKQNAEQERDRPLQEKQKHGGQRKTNEVKGMYRLGKAIFFNYFSDHFSISSDLTFSPQEEVPQPELFPQEDSTI